jgi:hypothetical protein
MYSISMTMKTLLQKMSLRGELRILAQIWLGALSAFLVELEGSAKFSCKSAMQYLPKSYCLEDRHAVDGWLSRHVHCHDI